MFKRLTHTFLAVLVAISIVFVPIQFVHAHNAFETRQEEVIYEEISPMCLIAAVPRYLVNASGTHFRATANGTSLGLLNANTVLGRINSTVVNGSTWLQFRVLSGVNSGRTGWICADLVTRSETVEFCW